MSKIDRIVDFRPPRKADADFSRLVWSAMSADSGPTSTAIDVLRSHPRFDDAFDRVTQGLFEHFRGNRIMNRVFNDRGRVMIGLLIIDLHYNGAAEGGLTATRLKRVCTEVNLCSPGRVTAILGTLRLFGFLAEAPTEDRRVRRLMPTEKFMRTHRVRWLCFFEALAMLMREGEAALGHLDEPRFIAGQIGVLGRMCRAGLRVEDSVPEFAGVFGRDSGIMIALTLAAAASDVPADSPVQVDMTVSELAKRFSVSRGHVLLVLRECERQGLVVRGGPRGRGIAVTAELRETAERFVAASLLFHAVSARAGLKALDDAEPVTAHG